MTQPLHVSTMRPIGIFVNARNIREWRRNYASNWAACRKSLKVARDADNYMLAATYRAQLRQIESFYWRLREQYESDA